MKRASSAWFAIEGFRVLNLVLALASVVLLAVLALVLVYEPPASIQATRFDLGQRCVEVPILTSYRRDGIAQLLAQPMTMPSSCWQPTPLPYISNIAPGGFLTETQPMSRAWIEVRYVVPHDWDSSEPLMIYVPRVNGWAWQVRVDGIPISDNLDNWRMTWNTPVTARLQPEHFRPGQSLNIQIGIAFLPEAGFSVSRITVGPASVVGISLAIRQFLQVSMPQACTTALLLMAAFFVAFWLSRRQERVHLLLSAGAVAWCITNLQYIVPRHDDPLLEGVYSAIINMSVSWLMWLIYLFTLQLDARRAHWIEKALPLFVLFMTVFNIPMAGLIFDGSVLVHSMNATAAGGVTAVIVFRAVRGGGIELRVVAAALFLAFLAGSHDVALLAQSVHPESIYLLPYAGLLVVGSFLFAVQRRYVRAIEDHETSETLLAQRLAAQEAELNANHVRLRELERTETLAAERQRLMHDMHDGIGSSLLTALAAAEQQELPQSELPKILRACIDDLRLVIDSLDPPDYDLVTLLSTIRHRLGQRFQATGVRLEWEIHDLPQLSWMESSDALHVLRIVQEALANVLKHANATQIRVATRNGRECVEIVVADNGNGFDASATSSGRGLRNMKRRAEELGGNLEVLAGAGKGTTLTLKLPMVRN